VPNQQANVTAAYLRFLNRAKHLSDALYKGGLQPNVTFSMQPVAAPDVSHITLTIDGQTLSTDMQSAHAQTFSWPGTVQNARLSVRFGVGGLDTQVDDRSGLWAIWHLLDTAERWQAAGTQYQMEWVQKTSAGPEMINGHPAAVKFALDPQGSQIFAPHYFSGIGCVSKAVQ
jgi:type VI protein secretion system component VasK